MNRKRKFVVLGALIWIAGAVFYYFDGKGIFVMGLLICAIFGIGLFLNPMSVGFRDSGDPIAEAEKESELRKERVSALVLGVVLVLLGAGVLSVG
jgi:hypothetical protein